MVTACLRAVDVDYFQNNLNIYILHVRLSHLSARLYHMSVPTTNLQYIKYTTVSIRSNIIHG